MRRLSVVSLCLLASSVLSLAGCHTAPAPGATEPELRQWIDDFDKAMVAKDVNAVMAFYAPDVVAYDIIPPLQYDGKDAYAADWRKTFAMFPGPISIEWTNCHFGSSGNLAYILCLQHFTGTTSQGQKFDNYQRATVILRKDNGKWLDIHDHISEPTDPATGKSLMDLKP